MKGIFGASRPRSVSFDFRHDARTSVWHKVAVRAHLIVAAVGTIALLGLAGTAIWLALPSQRPVAMAKASPAAAKPAAVAPAPVAEEDETPAAQNADELRQNAAPAAAEQRVRTVAMAQEPEPLPQADPRWTGPSKKSAKIAAAHSIVVGSGGEDEEAEPLAVNAYAGQDGGATAAIPAQKPAKADAKAAAAGVQTRPGQALQAVTMRARPSSRGAVLGTVPGRADVDVVSCDSWCEIVYDGKRGFVYKRFLKNNGR